MLVIRPEEPDDREAVRGVIIDAFCRSELGHNGEADIVDRIRDSCSDAVSLVATVGDHIVGHILFSPVTLSTDRGEALGMGLGPMAAHPERQRTGIGSALVAEGLRRLVVQSCPFVTVLGHPDYYRRFGFLPARQYGISHGFVGIPQDLFFIKVLDPGGVDSAASARAVYRTEFGPQNRGT